MCHVLSLFSNVSPVLGVILVSLIPKKKNAKQGEPACGVLNRISYFTLPDLLETTLSISCPRA